MIRRLCKCTLRYLYIPIILLFLSVGAIAQDEWKLIDPFPDAAGTNFNMAYDSNRDVVVMIVHNNTYDVWEWDGASWKVAALNISPADDPNNINFCIAFDPIRNAVVVHKSNWNDGTGQASEIWEWDGSGFTQINADSSTGYLRSVSMAFDEKNQQLVLFGGYGLVEGETNLFEFRNDTYIYDGSDWVVQNPALSPPTRIGHDMAYDKKNQVLVLFGGRSDDSLYDYLNDTWIWDGITWTEQNPTTLPSVRSGMSMAYDPVSQTVIMFGGMYSSISSSYYLNDTWSWNGTDWTLLSPTTLPGKRFSPGFFTMSGGATLIFGLNDTEDPPTDVWRWNGTDWISVHDVTLPTANSRSAMAYDSTREVNVVFGGWNSDDGVTNATWEYDGNTWQKVEPAANPPARTYPALAFDKARNKMVMFGGNSTYGGTGYLNDTWEWNGINWVEKLTGNVPPSRDRHGMAYDSKRGVVVLFGGGNLLDDTWTYDGTNWTEKSPSTVPTGRRYPGMAYDERRNVVVMFGGTNNGDNGYNDTWEWDGSNWTKRNPVQSPDARYWHVMAYAPDRGTVVVAGGYSDGTQLHDTWEWKGAANTWVKLDEQERQTIWPYMMSATKGGHLLYYDPTHKYHTWQLESECVKSYDINSDGNVTPGDALIVFKHYLGTQSVTDPCTLLKCDANGDGNITPGDALIIFKEYLGLN